MGIWEYIVRFSKEEHQEQEQQEQQERKEKKGILLIFLILVLFKFRGTAPKINSALEQELIFH